MGMGTILNEHVRVTTREVLGGIDVIIESRNGMTFSDGLVEKTLRLRDDHGPRIGSTVRLGRTTIKVAQRRHDEAGRLWLMDEDTRAWRVYE